MTHVAAAMAGRTGDTARSQAPLVSGVQSRSEVRERMRCGGTARIQCVRGDRIGATCSLNFALDTLAELRTRARDVLRSDVMNAAAQGRQRASAACAQLFVFARARASAWRECLRTHHRRGPSTTKASGT
eukprot:3028015-Prymnesium_polylepis.1